MFMWLFVAVVLVSGGLIAVSSAMGEEGLFADP